MGILAESRRKFYGLKERHEQENQEKQSRCQQAGTHDTSKGDLEFIYGKSATVPIVHEVKVGIRVIGECPNCHTHYERRPTREEMQTGEYREMRRQLETYEKTQERLHRRLM